MAKTIRGALPWQPDAGFPPIPPGPEHWVFFTAAEGAIIEALVDRLIPADNKTPGGKDMGCARFIDRQLAGPYGQAGGLYRRPPFATGTEQQGAQSPLTPAQRYRQGLNALAVHTSAAFAGKTVARLMDQEKDGLLTALESGKLALKDADGKAFFALLLTNTREGFFSDPIYGGNRDMAAWKMIGFPGARYDFRDWVEKHNERYTLPPVGIFQT